MPLKAGKSSETVSRNISEMMESKTFAKGKSRKKRHEMAKAAAMQKKRESLSRDAMK